MDILDNEGEENEKTNLIRREDDISSTKSADDSAEVPVKGGFSVTESFYVMIGFSIGANILVMPNTVRQLGILPWVLCLLGITLVLTICACLLWLAVRRMLEEKKDEIDVTRNAFPSLAGFSCGPIVRLFSIVFLLASALSTSICFLLLSASILADLVPIGAYSRGDVIRVWVVVIVCMLTPVTYLGTYSDVKLPATVALVTSLVATAAIYLNCVLYKYTPGELNVKKHQEDKQNILIPIGTLIFSMVGATYTVSNITVIASSPKKVPAAIISCNICVFTILLITGVTPYLTFGENTLPSTVSTFYQVINTKVAVGVPAAGFRILTVLLQVLMLMHFTMATVLDMNPCFLYVEDTLNIAKEFNIKRVLIRTSCMMFILGICVLVPRFEVAMGITGGVPMAFMCIFLPVVIYTKLFQTKGYKKILVFIFLLLVVVFILSTLLLSILDLIKT